MSQDQKGYTHPVGDLVAVALLLCDDNIETGSVQASPSTSPGTEAHAHCTWKLSSNVYTDEELVHILRFLQKFRDHSDDPFTFRCFRCGLDWIDKGPCADDCVGDLPDFYRFEQAKRVVMGEKRQAQSDLAEARDAAKRDQVIEVGEIEDER
jgi:hypothetical protein